MARPKPGEPSWRWRRIIIYAVLAFACWQLYRLVDASDSRLNETIAWGWQVIVMVLVTGYTGFATAQDIAAIWTTRTGRPYADPPVDPVSAPLPENTTVVVQPKNPE
jgi:hypothetical protein